MPDIWMDVDAALSEVPVNIVPAIDDTDFKSIEDGITWDQAGMDLVWIFVTTAGVMTTTAVTPTNGGDYDWVNQGDGMYSIEIPDAGGADINNDTEGFGWFKGFCTGVLPWRGPTIGFRAAALNNALVDGGDTLDVNVTAMAANVITAAAINAAAFTTAKFAGDFLTNALIADDAFAVEQFKDAFLTAAKIAGDAITNAKIADNTLGTEQFVADFLTNALIADNALNTEQFVDGFLTAAKIAANAITDAKINAAAFTTAKFAGDFLTNALIADDAFAVEQFKDAFLTAAKIAGDAITNAKIADNTLGTEQFVADFLTNALIADNALNTEQFVDGFLTAAKIAANAITDAKINAAAFTTAKFAGDFLTNALIADNALDTEQFANGAFTVAKFATAYALASECTAARLGELDAANLPTDIANVAAQNVLILADTGALNAQNVLILVDTAALLARIVGTLLAGNHTAQSGDGFARLGAPAGASVSADIAGINIRPTRGAALGIDYPLVSNVDGRTFLTGQALLVAVQVRTDAGAFAPATNAIAEIGVTGIYTLTVSAAEMTGDKITILTTGPNTDARQITIFTQRT